jgi:CheY-like chemotaxis protein
MAHRAVCVTGNPVLRRTLRRTLQAAGSVVELLDDAQSLDLSAKPAPDLIVFDKESRRGIDAVQLSQKLGDETKIVILGESLEEESVLDLLRAGQVNHIIAEQSEPSEEELVVTSVKALKGDIFGLEKYLAWGALVHEREVVTYDDKRDALLEVSEYAKDMGARRQTIARIESVADELLMNALYDAPAIRYGVRARITERSRSGVGPLGGEPASLRYACDGRFFAVSVRDNYGELRKDAILDNLSRARAERGTPQIDDSGAGRGAGLGLYFILSSVTRFIANISPGHMTEVVCLFDIKAAGRDQDGCARSLHIFTTAAAP